MAAKKKRQSRALVLSYLEQISSGVFQKYPQQITDLVGEKHGVYALYKQDTLYYVGLAVNLRRRVNHHLKDKHAGKWDRFSLYLVRRESHVKEIESLILRVADPKGNATKGALPGAINLKRGLKSNLKKAQGAELSKMLGSKRAPKRKPQGEKKPSSKTEKSKPALAPYGKRRFKIRAEFKGYIYGAWVRSNGIITYDGVKYRSPSGAAKVIVGGPVNGWVFWTFRSGGRWVKLKEIKR